MMRFLRSQSQTVLIVVLVVIGFGFLFYGNAGELLTSQGAHLHNDFGRIDGQDLSVAELYDAIHNTRDTFLITGRAQQLSQRGARAQLAQEAWRQLLLLHEADKLHVEVTTGQLLDTIQGMPVFQKNGVYSPEVYQTQMTNLQNSFHISPDTFATVLKNNLRMEAVRDALFSSVRASSQDLAAQYEKYYGPATVTFVTLNPKSFIDAAQVTSEEIQSEYKSHPENPAYRTKEKRKIDYVFFGLTPEQAKLEPKAKTTAIEALGEKALNFALTLQPDPSATTSPPPVDFTAEAKKAGLTPVTTDFFTVETPPAGVPPSPSFNNAAFTLTKDDPVSKVVQMANGVAVLHLAEIQASDLRPLEEVKADILKTLKQGKGAQAQHAAAQTTAGTLKALVAKGTDFKAAAAGMNLKTETVPAFVPMKAPPNDPRLRTIAFSIFSLSPGGISAPVPVQSDDSVVIVHLDGRAKADPAGLAQFETQYREQQEQELRSYAYVDWAEWISKQPGTRKPPDLEQYGSLE